MEFARFASLLLFALASMGMATITTTTTRSEDNNVDVETTEKALVIRRRPRPPSSGSRLSLMNSRFSRRPRKKNLDREQLLEILGKDFDPRWMSIDEPSALASKDPERGAVYRVEHDSWHYAELVKQLRAANLSYELAKVGGHKFLEDPIYTAAVEKWLLKKASCPVRYAWEDIGTLFWPRYVKRGECFSTPGTCSWPPGMHCVPSGTSSIHLLRWQCKIPKGKGRKKLRIHKERKEWSKRIAAGEQHINLRCQWIRVPYPITSSCLCTC